MEPDTPINNPPPPRQHGATKYLLIALIPLPIGFIIGPTHLMEGLLGKKPDNVIMIAFNVMTVICCVVGSIGMFDGYKKGAWIDWTQGILVGVILWVVETFIMSFIGCCQGVKLS